MNKHRELLLKYMAHIINEESIDYIDSIAYTNPIFPFSEEEINELMLISSEIAEELNW